MICKLLKTKGAWRDIADAANTTVGKEAGEKEPSSNWKIRILLAEHSPIRQLIIKSKWYDLMYWISVHIVRHKIGIEHWVRTQRTDRTNINRNELPQSSFVEHEIEANAQAIINISRKRLCNMASPETREAWREFLNSFKDKQPELYSVCVCDCLYRGWCYEFKSCGYHKTQDFKNKLKEYRENINE
jgi:hypothetical protein